MRNYILICLLAVSAVTLNSRVCARLLMLDDSELEQKNLTRIYTNVRDYYVKNEVTIQTLDEKGFFSCSADSFDKDEASRKALRELAVERKSFVTQYYKSEDAEDFSYLGGLYQDLIEISQILTSNEDKEFLFGLHDKREVTALEKYMGILLCITSYFQYSVER